jgi:ATP-dependent protease ClpP protease subunit
MLNWIQNKKRKLDDINTKTKNSKKKNEDEDEDDPFRSLFSRPKSDTLYTQNNHIYFHDDITDESAISLNKELRTLEVKLKKSAIESNIVPEPIILHITTNGGSIYAAFTIIDCISQLSITVNTVVDGFVASAGTLISLAGETRYISENAYMLIHELRSGVWGKMSEIEDEYSNSKKMMTHIIDYYNKKTKLTKKALEKLLTKDLIWNAEECIQNGLVSGVYKPKTLKLS